jgi:hypothetical protein
MPLAEQQHRRVNSRVANKRPACNEMLVEISVVAWPGAVFDCLEPQRLEAVFDRVVEAV